MERLDFGQMQTQRVPDPFGQEGDPVLLALAIAHRDLPIAEIHVFDAQPDTFHEPQARAVEQPAHELESGVRREGVKQIQGLLPGEHDWQLPGSSDAFDILEGGQFDLKHLSIEKKQCAQGLVLGGSGDLGFHGEVGQERLHFRRSQVLGVTLAVKEDEALDPVQVRLLGADAVVLEADDGAHLLQERSFFGLATQGSRR